MQNPIEKPDYRGKRAAIYLRVSDPKQEKMYGFQFQERGCRQLVEELGMTLDAERHIVRDKYTGMEWRQRPELRLLLEMAKRREFDVLVMWKLDRFARKGLHQSIVREELKYYGVTILTTDPDEHADDDSALGEVIRAIYGFKAEEERNSIVERTMSGRRERALEGKMIGGKTALYGYIYDKENGVYLPNDRPLKLNGHIILDEEGSAWTEVKVVRLIFKLAAEGSTIRSIAKYLTDIKIPPPMKTRGKHGKGAQWHPASISRMLRHPFYKGKGALFRRHFVKEPGGKKRAMFTPEAEQIVLPESSVPAIVDSDVFDAVQGRLKANQQFAARNSKQPLEAILRSGLAQCGLCKGNLTTHRGGSAVNRIIYSCTKANNGFGRCPGVNIEASILDKAAWDCATKIILDPSEVDKRVAAWRSEDETADRRKRLAKEVAAIARKQETLRSRLEDDLDSETYTSIKARLKQLAEEKYGYEQELRTDEDIHREWKELEKKLDIFHQRCAEMREKISDPSYNPSYEFKRDACVFLGIQATVYAVKHKPRYEITCLPPSIALPSQSLSRVPR
jgi:site-specific DNA recombinase